MTKKLLPILALLAACGGPISEETWSIADASADEDAGESEVEVGVVSEELLACDTKKMHDASRKFFLGRAPKNTVCSGKTTDQYWACTSPGGRTWSVFAYNMTNVSVTRNVQGSQAKTYDYVCDYSASCQLSCRLIISI